MATTFVDYKSFRGWWETDSGQRGGGATRRRGCHLAAGGGWVVGGARGAKAGSCEEKNGWRRTGELRKEKNEVTRSPYA
jgi:hypothetical protein